MRDDEEDGAPPTSAVDLGTGKAIIRIPGSGVRRVSAGAGR
ncbi:DUF6191 domain-containing protein [Streptomyces sp. TLI_55]|nr:DUF6191 domain-containing protein [Streptomyces sp. TLI_55]